MYLKYLPKRTHYGYEVMVHASMLAALDHNNNVNREPVGEIFVHYFAVVGNCLTHPTREAFPGVLCDLGQGFQNFLTQGTPINYLLIHGTPELHCYFLQAYTISHYAYHIVSIQY